MIASCAAHIQQSSRVELGKKFESGFYAKPDTPSPQAVPAAGEPTISMTALLELLKDADPEMKAKLRLALQYSALHHRTWITPTVQKPCNHGSQNKKAMKSFDPQLPR